MNNTKIAIIGCGNLGMAILNGLLQNPEIEPSNITITKRDIRTVEHLQDSGIHITADNAKAIGESELIIFGLKPYTLLPVLQDVSPVLQENKHIIVSLATGVSINSLRKTANKSIPIFRAMPNTAADVSTSMTCICTDSNDQQVTQIVDSCFNSIGNTIFINESLMDSATVLGACGIAYVMRFIRAMVQGGIQIGFDSKTASAIVNQTVKGAAELLLERKEHPEYEIDKVTTPKGCTIAGLNEMEHNGFSSALIKGIVTSYDAIEK